MRAKRARVSLSLSLSLYIYIYIQLYTYIFRLRSTSWSSEGVQGCLRDHSGALSGTLGLQLGVPRILQVALGGPKRHQRRRWIDAHDDDDEQRRKGI